MKIATLACGDVGDPTIPLGLDGVVYVDDLCRRPDDLTRSIGDADRLVVIVHPTELSLAKVQRSARIAGIDPLGIQYLSADTIAGDARRAALLIEGAAARVAAFGESRPEHARPTFGGRRTRRDLLSVPQPHYEVVPLIDDHACAAADGCRACVTECPQAAYRWELGRVHFDREACVACGRCVTACPTGAIGNPTIGGQALVGQITALVGEPSSDPIGIAFVCRQRTNHITSIDWAEVEVPCTGMIPPTWLIAALLLGGAAGAVVPCSANGCGLGNDARSVETVALARELIASAGFNPASATAAPSRLSTPFPRVDLDDPFGTHGPTEVALALRSIAVDQNAIDATGPTAGRGIVMIDGTTCTLCLRCTETCPTSALHSEAAPGKLRVMFDAALCTGCFQCVPACPELERGAIRLERRVATAALSAGPQPLAESATRRCELCGAPIASSAMLGRISQLLGSEHGAAVQYLERRCLDCRGTH
jgi:ferredoxin